MKQGEIVMFTLIAKCPYCHEQTAVFEAELKLNEVVCQHCGDEFSIELDA